MSLEALFFALFYFSQDSLASVSKTGRSNPVQVRVLSSAPTNLDMNWAPFFKIAGFFFVLNRPRCDRNVTENFGDFFEGGRKASHPTPVLPSVVLGLYFHCYVHDNNWMRI